MSDEQITQETVPVEQTTTEAQPQATQSTVAKADTPAPQPTQSTIQSTTQSTWKDSISEEYRNDPNIEKFTEIDALAKSYINATRMIGQDKIAVPNQNSTQETWDEAYSKLGRPETPDQYNLKIESNVVQMDESAIKSFAEQSHKLGLSNKQAEGILDFYKNNMEDIAQQSKIDTETAHAQSEQELRQEWGKSFDENVKKAAAVAKANLGADFLDSTILKDGSVLGSNTTIIKGFLKIANMMSEDKIVTTESENVNTSKDLETEISSIMNDKNHPYHIKGHPDHDKSVQQMLTLREMLDVK